MITSCAFEDVAGLTVRYFLCLAGLGAGIVIVRVLLTGVLPGWLTVTVTRALR